MSDAAATAVAIVVAVGPASVTAYAAIALLLYCSILSVRLNAAGSVHRVSTPAPPARSYSTEAFTLVENAPVRAALLVATSLCTAFVLESAPARPLTQKCLGLLSRVQTSFGSQAHY